MTLQFRRIGHRLIFAVGSVVILGVLGIVINNAIRQEKVTVQETEAALTKTSQSVEQGLSALMQVGHAKDAADFAKRLKTVPNIVDYRMLRANGTEAFIDNLTVDRVNEKLGEFEFTGRHKPAPAEQVLAATDPNLVRVLTTGQRVFVYQTLPGGERLVTSLGPNLSQPSCEKCHDAGAKILGVLKLTVSLKQLDHDVRKTWQLSILLILAALSAIVVLIYWAARRTVVSQIVRFSSAMQTAAGGDLTVRLPTTENNELGYMAQSFNQMNDELIDIYAGLKDERHKLNTIIQGADSGIVVTDACQTVVLVNEAAEKLLGKAAAKVTQEGFLMLFDDPAWMQVQLATPPEASHAVLREWQGKTLSIQASTIRDAQGEAIGSAALIRDVTEEKQLEAQLQAQSITDALTGLHNRRHFDEVLDTEFKRWKRYAQPLSVMMLDIDHFKKFNDTHGHDCGDRVLMALGAVLKAAASAAVIPCRYGGEEMVIVMPGLTAEKAFELAERLRLQIAALVLDGLQVTVSIGVASCPGARMAANAEALVKQADEALYAAKENGRNQVRVA
jgi:diguanylate cyclase (GGDEF)-like protein/PAS domain S-box-containing protein